jgi:fructose-bisphosphate aldolase class 1
VISIRIQSVRGEGFLAIHRERAASTTRRLKSYGVNKNDLPTNSIDRLSPKVCGWKAGASQLG